MTDEPRPSGVGAGDDRAVSVIVCTYTEARWAVLVDAIASVQRQSRPADELIVVVDHNDGLLRRAAEQFPGVTVVANEHDNGLSGARNTGVRHATGDVVVFLDDDAVAEPGWLSLIVGAYKEESVIGVGGSVRPRWAGQPPRWLPPEFYWVVGCSYRGLPTQRAEIRNPVGANASFRRAAFDVAGEFKSGLGRVGRVPLGCEETEFAIRVRQRLPNATILYVPEAAVDHLVPAERTTWRYFRSRCWAEGLSKAVVASEVGSDQGLASERSYTQRTLPLGVTRGLRDALRGDGSGLARAGAIVVGLAVTAAGYARGRLAARSVRGPRRNG